MAVNMTMVWLIAMIALFVIEALVPGLISIWFAIGAFAALISALVKAPLWLQVFWFLLVSAAMLGLTRPFVKKYVNAKVQPTNADMVIGKEGVVLEDIDNVLGTGAVSAEGKVWTARSEDDSASIKKGERVSVLRIEGVKLIVKKQ